MSESEEKGSLLSQHFEIGAHRYATRSSEGIEAVEKLSRERVLIWLLRHPLSPGSPAEERFLQRLEQVGRLQGPFPRFRAFGVEPGGSAYLITDFVAGEKLIAKTGTPQYQAALFLQAVQAVASLHGAGLQLGDISEDSFIVNIRGSVIVSSLLGTFDVEARRTAMLPSAATLQYLSPEQRSGAGADCTTDVYALGILGYRLLCGRYPLGDKPPAALSPTDDPLSAAPAPSVVRNELPLWIDDILGTCLLIRPQERYPDARALQQELEGALATGETSGGRGRWSHRTLIVRQQGSGVDVYNTERGVGMPYEAQEEEPAEPGKISAAKMTGRRAPNAPVEEVEAAVEEEVRKEAPAKGMLIAAVSLFLGVMVAGLLFLFRQGPVEKPEIDDPQLAQPDFVPVDLQPAINDLLTTGVSSDQKRSALEKIVSSEAPAAFTILMSVSKSNKIADVRTDALNAILKKIKESGLTRSADVLANWFSALQSSGFDPTRVASYTSLLKACDLTLPLDARRTSIHKAFADDKQTALMLAAALAIDDPEPDHFTPVLRQILIAQGGRPELNDRGLAALLVSDKTLSMFFDRDVLGMLPKFSPGDLAWSILRLSQMDSPLLYEVANETLRRNIVPPYQSIFLKILVRADSFSTTRQVKLSLVRAARGEVSREDLTAFNSWPSIEVSSILLSICAISKDPVVAQEAFDILVSRGTDSEPARSLLVWVRERYWSHRGRLVKAVGILGQSDMASDREVDYAFDSLMPFSGSGSLFQSIVKSGEVRLIRTAVDRMGNILSSSDLLNLLTHADPGVRLAAVKALQGRNELSVLQLISRNYERERDEDVRAAYRQYHWVIADREKKRAAQGG